jgi:hypothetical protein
MILPKASPDQLKMHIHLYACGHAYLPSAALNVGTVPFSLSARYHEGLLDMSTGATWSTHGYLCKVGFAKTGFPIVDQDAGTMKEAQGLSTWHYLVGCVL